MPEEVIGKIFEFWVFCSKTKQNNFAVYMYFAFESKCDFCPQTKACLSGFLVTGSEYTYSILIFKHIKFRCVA